MAFSRILGALLALIAIWLFKNELLRLKTLKNGLSSIETLKPLKEQYHRRLKGIVLILILALMIFFQIEVEKMFDNLFLQIIYLGLLIALVITLVVLALYDFRKTAQSAIQDHQHLAVSSLKKFSHLISKEHEKKLSPENKKNDNDILKK